MTNNYNLTKRTWTLCLLFISFFLSGAQAASKYDNPDTIVVARDGTGEFRTVAEAIEVCRAFMDYHKVIYVKKGTYKEKIIVPQWLQHIEICGEDRDQTIITWDDHANILYAPTGKGMGTFRTYTVRVDGNDITFKNITIENNAARLGQAVALHTQGDRLLFVNCRLLGNQDTVYTGMPATRLYFEDCYIEGTTDFIFGPSTAWFERCHIHCKSNSYITAASTPKDVKYGYIFNNCRVTIGDGVSKVYLGRPWRDYGYTLFMHCQLPAQIAPQGWHHWQKEREKTARYMEFENSGEGAAIDQRVAWSRQLTKKEAREVTLEDVFQRADGWNIGK
ncbi:MAG: pectin esterase [Prevotella sp.]|nr:pectin esterase [Prevotella sp.]